MNGTAALQSPTTQMLRMLNAHWTVQALYVAASFGIADLLADGPRSVEELARKSGAHAASLYRVLRSLASFGVFHEDDDGRFSTTPLGATLGSSGADSVRDWALFVGQPVMWENCGKLRECVVTGQPAFPRTHGMSLWSYMGDHPELGEPFDRWMTQQSAQHNASIVAAYDFSGFHTVADIGGGKGATLAAIMRAALSVRGVLLDLPHVVASVPPIDEAGLASRCEVIGGDMLAGVPPGADAYVIKRVLMDWDDQTAVRILRHCADAMGDGARVLVIEMVVPPGNEPGPAKTFDLTMMLNHGSPMRTLAEFERLFAEAGLRLTRVIPTASSNTILECEAG